MQFLYILNEDNFENIFKEYNIQNIVKNEYGKKYCDNVFFSVSHSFDKHIIIISDSEIGIDIEKKRKYNPILYNILSDEELNNLNNNDFWKYWTLKESFIKYKGLYIDNNIDKIIFQNIDKDDIKCYYNGTQQDMYFKSFEFDDYIISISSKEKINLKIF